MAVKYPPLFRKINVSTDNGKKISKIQDMYEKFWHAVTKDVEKNHQRVEALKKMQESCMWLSRAIAYNYFSPEDEKGAQDQYGQFNVKVEKASETAERVKLERESQSKTKIVIKPSKKIMVSPV